MIFFITFGQNHPLRDHWVEVRAKDYDAARAATFEVLGPKFAFFYDKEHFSPEYFPCGKVGRTIQGEEE